MTLNLQDFQPSSSSESEEEIVQEAEIISQLLETEITQSQESQEEESESFSEGMIQTIEPLDLPAPIADTNTKEVSKETLEALTKELFEKIAKSAKVPSKSAKVKEQIAEKKVTPSEALLENLLAKKSEELLDQKRLAETVSYEEKLAKEKRLEEKLRKEAFLKAQEKKQEMIAKEKAFKEEQERLAKKEEKAKKLAEEEAEKIARAEATLAQQEQIRKIKEAKAEKAARIAKARNKQKQQEKQKQHKRIVEKRLAAKKAIEKRQKSKAKRKGTKQEKHKSKNKQLNHLSKDTKKSPPKEPISRSTRKMINSCYGSEFNGFTGTQKSFIEKNLGNIYVITQRVLSRMGYPNVAKRTHQQGTQLVTFYLHPNGRISKLRLKERIGYASLDQNTLQVVRIAHANYPRPKTTTKINFYVVYSRE